MTIGAKPRLQPWATSTAAIDVARSRIRDPADPALIPAWVNSPRYPVQASTSSNTSGRSTRGIIRVVISRNATSDAGSATASGGLRCSRILPERSASSRAGESRSRSRAGPSGAAKPR